METWLALDGRSKQLCLHAKKTFQHSSDVALKIKGVLNTVTAAYQVDGALFKVRRLPPPPGCRLLAPAALVLRTGPARA